MSDRKTRQSDENNRIKNSGVPQNVWMDKKWFELHDWNLILLWNDKKLMINFNKLNEILWKV